MCSPSEFACAIIYESNLGLVRAIVTILQPIILSQSNAKLTSSAHRTKISVGGMHNQGRGPLE